MSRSKQSTPSLNEDHPAHKLTFVDDQIKQQLLKTPVKLLIEDDNYKTQLQELRSDWKYACCLQWFAFFKNAAKLSNETITADLIEEELVGLTEEHLMVKIPVALAATLIGSKVTIDDFSYRVRFLLGDSCKILGTEEAPIEFKQLSLVEKFALFYELIQKIQNTDQFRAQVEKYENDSELRFDSIFEKNDEESYYLLSDNRIYLRKLTNWPKYNIPHKFKRAKLSKPEEDLASIEPTLHWECVAIGIYEIHAFIDSIKSNKSMKPLFQNIKDHIDAIATDDLQTRKKILKRKRETQMTQLLSNRKRSSRIQLKEEQNKIEQERLAAEAEEEKQRQLKARKQRKLKQKENLIKKEVEERLRRTQASTSRTRTSFLTNLRGSTPATVEKPAESTEQATVVDTESPEDATNTTIAAAVEEPEAPKLNIDALDLKSLQEDEWLFQCPCGIHEKNYDDGTKQITCDKCHRWQHLKCQPRSVQQELVQNAEEPFICSYCKEDFELEVLEKLESEELARLEEERLRKLELLEKQRQRELAKIKRQEEEKIQQELERQQREELEKERERERERRIQERREALALNTTDSQTPEVEETPALPNMGTFASAPVVTVPSTNGETASSSTASVPIPQANEPAKELNVEQETQDYSTQPLPSSQPEIPAAVTETQQSVVDNETQELPSTQPEPTPQA
ncbi:hypothetical protein WICPIJ_006819 [Wickerhamomyces pijperi]|uniref:Zinc finger PHD-type domain-containing protein n=1 Tax=Wickerhamomyces pijperi TaxID=599730 RepID=A0A9P8Q109_WICPI|nr:hypothetical protein WICPIJ_006819 [Wickerhamomyces pijperi]